MLKTFFFGILLGLVVAAGALYAIPVVDQHREASIISVAANASNVEVFYINIPEDRIMLGAAAQSTPLPAGMLWPDDNILQNIRAELFKIRNTRDVVIGVAARTAAKNGGENNIEWVIHLPARGSVLFHMDPVAQAGGFRIGELRSGSREFERLVGSLSERWIANEVGGEDTPAGRIELQAYYVSISEPLK